MVLRVVLAALALCCEPQAGDVEIEDVEVVEFVEPIHIRANADRTPLPPAPASPVSPRASADQNVGQSPGSGLPWTHCPSTSW